jgi:hypothetical protein
MRRGPSPTVMIPADTLDALTMEVRTMRLAFEGKAAPALPPTRRYTLAETGLRLIHGCDPRLLPAGCTGLDETTIRRLAKAFPTVLRIEKVGGSSTITEASVQLYEQLVAQGDISGFVWVRCPAIEKAGMPAHRPRKVRTKKEAAPGR